jgi:chromate transporter
VGERQYGPLRLYWPDANSFSLYGALLTLLAAVLIFRFKWNVITTLAVTGTSGLLLGQLA